MGQKRDAEAQHASDEAAGAKQPDGGLTSLGLKIWIVGIGDVHAADFGLAFLASAPVGSS